MHYTHTTCCMFGVVQYPTDDALATCDLRLATCDEHSDAPRPLRLATFGVRVTMRDILFMECRRAMVYCEMRNAMRMRIATCRRVSISFAARIGTCACCMSKRQPGLAHMMRPEPEVTAWRYPLGAPIARSEYMTLQPEHFYTSPHNV